jgi:SAM-dependent methyltransferase
MRERYIRGEIPWDDVLPPPEVRETLAGLSIGRALDLGCGYGRTAIYLARAGWRVDAVDFVEEAIAEAHRRAIAADVAGIRFHVATVTELDFLSAPYDLAIDVGCGHGLDEVAQDAYWAELKRLLKPGATFLWFVRLKVENETGDRDGPGGIALVRVRQLCADGFQVAREEIGMTDMADDSSWPSAWFWLVRQSDA